MSYNNASLTCSLKLILLFEMSRSQVALVIFSKNKILDVLSHDTTSFNTMPMSNSVKNLDMLQRFDR